MLNGKPHNNHVAEGEEQSSEVDEAEEDFETIETVKFNEDGDVELDEEDVIDESTMQRWCQQSIEVI